MPSKTDFNVSPYYDDFAESKKFHRIMYRPAFAVQARELTTQQAILQNQIEKLADSMYKHGSMVIPGEVTYDLNHFSIKLTSFTGTLANFAGTAITGGTSGVVADVLSVVATDGTDPDTLFVKYRNSGTDNASDTFTDGETLTSDASTGETAVVASSHTGCAAFVDAGTYYINGFFVEVDSQSLILDKYTNTPDYRVGLTVTENFVTSTDDSSLLDNATGSSNINATGAHRFKITLTLAKLTLTSTADSNFVETFRLKNGKLQNKPVDDVRTSIEDTLARRTYDESGDYTVDDFELDIREHLLAGTNRGIYAADTKSDDGNTATDDKLAFGLSQGKAYVKGYEIAKIGTTYIDVDKARDFETDSGITTRFDVGSFVNVEEVFGTPDINFVSGEIENYKTLRLVDTAHTTRGTVFGTALAHVFDIGRAKTRAFEYNSGSAVSPDSGTTTHLSNAATREVKFKHFLFDVEMFTHINVSGVMSGALTTGDILTGETSGATGIIESTTTEGSATITGVSQASPAVVTCSGGHNFTDGQVVTIASVVGMANTINSVHIVKNPTATTFEIFDTGSKAGVDLASSSAYSSGGTAKHTTIVLSNVSGEFAAGETISAPTNSRTGTVQADFFGKKGFEQKSFNQTKGISMAGSPTYTSNVSLDSIFGDDTTLTGVVSTVDPSASAGSIIMNGTDANGSNSGDSIILEDATEGTSIDFGIGLEDPADQADVLVGSGTKFTEELKIGDQIFFVDNQGSTVTRIVQNIESNTRLQTKVGLGTASATSRQVVRQRAKLQDASKNTAIFKLPYDVVKTLLTDDNAGLSDTSFKIRRQFVTTLSSSGTGSLTAGTNEVFSAFSENDYAVSIMSTGSGSTGTAGDVISLSTANDFTLGGSPTGKTLAINLGSGYNGHKIKVSATVSTSVAPHKTKTNTSGETVTIDTEALATAENISLGKADVHKLNSVFMASDFSTAAVTTDTDITSRFNFDTGQRDNFYDIARLTLKPGEPAPTGRLLINFDYFEHGAGNFFSVDSYSGFTYKDIPGYTSDITGENFSLRDCLDFRPRVDDASTINSGSVDRSFDGTGASSIEFTKINSDVTADLEYYLAKRGRVYLTSKGQFKVVTGASAIEPGFGEQLKDAIHLYDVFMPAFTFDIETIEIKAIDNRRYTMRDIGGLHKRIENLEYYTQLSLLEANAQNLQIQDADGFDRFKNGFIVDNFTGHGIGDVTDNDYSISMDMAAGELRPSHHMDNSNLIESDSSLGNSTSMTDTIRTTNGYQKTGDLITLPYTEVTEIEQQFASTVVNLNPYDTISFVGNVVLSPDQDDWMETETLPEMTVNIPGVFDTLTGGAGESVRELNLGTVWNEWNNNWSSVDIAGTEQTERRRDRRRQWPFIRDVSRTTVNTQEVNNRTRTGVRTTLVPGGLRNTSIGNRVVQVAFATFIRAKDISFTAKGMKPGTRVYPFFDGVDVSTLVTPTGSSAGAALTTNAAGQASGVFSIPAPVDPRTIRTAPGFTAPPRWRVGKRVFRLTSSSTNVKTEGLVTTSAETDYTAKGLIQTVQGTVISTRETVVQRTTSTDTSQVIGAQGTRIVRDETGGWFDPVCQSFMVDKTNGLYISSIEVFFATKSSSLPVTLQIRTMVNGYPTTTVVPFGQQTVDAADITTSTDASEATKFTFPSPVFLQNGIEYAFCVITNNTDYTMYTSRLGETTLDGSRLISNQPYLGSMFKSQNASTWTSEQNEDVKFKINRCKFTENTEGTVTFVNDVVPLKTLRHNPITTTASSADITIHHRNHGMHSTDNNVTIAGVASGTYNGIASTNINGTYTTIKNIKMHSYQVTAANSDAADATGDVGGSSVTVTRNIMYDVIKPIAGVIQPPGTELSATLRTTTGKTLEGSETEFALVTASKQVAIDLNEDYYMTAPRIVASAINETNEMSGSKSLSMALKIKTQTGDDNISPIIDTTRLSAHLIRNHLYNPVSGTTPDFVADTAKSGGSSSAKYITRAISLEDEATSIDVRISADVPSTSEVEAYFRTSNADDARDLKGLVWTPFNTDGSPDKAVTPTDDGIFKEHQYSVASLAPFTAFQLKLVLKGTVSSYPPRIKDLRGIALAV